MSDCVARGSGSMWSSSGPLGESFLLSIQLYLFRQFLLKSTFLAFTQRRHRKFTRLAIGIMLMGRTRDQKKIQNLKEKFWSLEASMLPWTLGRLTHAPPVFTTCPISQLMQLGYMKVKLLLVSAYISVVTLNQLTPINCTIRSTLRTSGWTTRTIPLPTH